jgi:hypothetical protein
MAEALQVYRTLLRAINRNITTTTGNRQWYVFATEEFRKHSKASDDKERAELLQLARDYAFMINGVKDHTVSNLYSDPPAFFGSSSYKY